MSLPSAPSVDQNTHYREYRDESENIYPLSDEKRREEEEEEEEDKFDIFDDTEFTSRAEPHVRAEKMTMASEQRNG